MYQKATVPACTQCLYSLWFAMTLGETGLNEQRTIVCTEVTAMEWNIYTYTIENVLFRKNLLDTLFIFMYVGEIHVCLKYHFIKYYS